MNLIKHRFFTFLFATIVLFGFAGACSEKEDPAASEMQGFVRSTNAMKPLADDITRIYTEIISAKKGEDIDKIRLKLKDVQSKVEVMIEPFKAFEPSSPDVKKIRDSYVDIWESYHRIITQAAEAHEKKTEEEFEKARDKLGDRLKALEKKRNDFREEYSKLVNKYGI